MSDSDCLSGAEIEKPPSETFPGVVNKVIKQSAYDNSKLRVFSVESNISLDTSPRVFNATLKAFSDNG